MTSPDSPSLSTEKPRLTQASSWTCTGCGATAKFDERGWLKCPCNCSTGGTFTHPCAPALSEGEPTPATDVPDLSTPVPIEGTGIFASASCPHCGISVPHKQGYCEEINQAIDNYGQYRVAAALVFRGSDQKTYLAALELEREALLGLRRTISHLAPRPVEPTGLEELFRVQEREIQRLKNDLRINGLTFEQKCTLGRLAHLIVGTEDGLPIEWGKMVPAAQRLLSDNERLRATALTPEEASAILEQPVLFMGKRIPEELIEKLRRISRRSLSGETK